MRTLSSLCAGHPRDGRRFSQLGVEVDHLDGAGRISPFWALIHDTTAFDEFFAGRLSVDPTPRPNRPAP